MPKISIIVPCYNEEAALPLFYREITRVAGEMDDVDFEFIFIDDGSRDNTLPELRRLAAQDKRVRFVSFSRNFGKEAGMLAGLEAAVGDYVALMDADLQDPPTCCPRCTRRSPRRATTAPPPRRTTRAGEPPIRSFFARLFYKLINRISDADIVDGARDYRLMRRSMVDAILSMREYNRFSKGIFGWVGFKTKWVPFVNVERIAGETKWSFWKLFRYSLEGIIAFSTMPLAIASVLGVLTCLIAFVFVAVVLVKTLVLGDPVGGWPSTMCVILFLGGVQLLCIGILGQYLARTYLEAKRRPVYWCARPRRASDEQAVRPDRQKARQIPRGRRDQHAGRHGDHVRAVQPRALLLLGVERGQLHPDQCAELFPQQVFHLPEQREKRGRGAALRGQHRGVLPAGLRHRQAAVPGCARGRVRGGAGQCLDVVGMCLFTGFNYLGQRFFAFRTK